MQARKTLMKAAAADLRTTLEGEAWSVEVLCSKVMKRKTLYCCRADPDKPVSRWGWCGDARLWHVQAITAASGWWQSEAGERQDTTRGIL